jgi:hypothetical protein
MRERATRSRAQDCVRALPTMSSLMLAVGANGGKPKMKLPDVPSENRKRTMPVVVIDHVEQTPVE